MKYIIFESNKTQITLNIKLLFLLFISIFYLKVSAQVTADFAANTTSGCPNPLLVIVNDLSSNPAGGALSYSWQLTGPAGFTTITSSTNQISTSLSIPGFYSVELTVCNGIDCDTKIESNYIEIFDVPSFSYTFNPMSGCAPQQICFDGTINAGCGTVSNVLFDSNDGIVYNTEDFCHTYTTVGDYYNFTVSVENSCGCVVTEVLSDTISIASNPTASFTASQTFSCTPPLNVNFTNTSSASSSATYEWNIPGLVSGASTTNLSQSFGVGTYDVELIVTEPQGCSDTLLLQNYISVGNPIADFSANNTTICEGQSIQFNDLSNGSPTAWSWQIIGGPSSNAQNPSFTLNTAGVYDVELTTSYAGGCQDVELKTNYITVNSVPVNSYTVTDTSSCLLPFTTTFTATTAGSAASSWVFPGGTPSSYSGSGPINVTYNSYGNYAITLMDSINSGCFGQTTFNNVIELNQLTASIVADTIDGCIPIVSNLSVSTNGVDSITNYSWTLPGSNILNSNSSEPSAIYGTTGCFDVSVSLTSTLGCMVNLNETNFICTGTPPIADFSFTPTSTCFEVDDICFTFTGSGADTVLWDFDDGPPLWAGPSSMPCHAYNSDIGDYSPSVIAFDNGCPSDTLTFTDSVEILGPVSVFTSDFESCENWNTVEFTNASVQADSFYWEFGDTSVLAGTDTSTLENPTWVYPAYLGVSNYTATLTVYNFTTGCDHSSSNTFSIIPTEANFTVSDSIGCAPFTTTFTNTSISTGPTTWFTRWNWDSTYYFGSSPANMNSVWNNASVRSKTYNSPGVYDVIMRNLNSNFCQDTILKENYIVVHGVLVDFDSDITEGCFPLNVNFYDSSSAPLSYVNSWHWDFGTGNASDTSNVQNPSFIYNDPGNYDITLTATDSFGCIQTLTFNNYIYVHDPVASFSISDTFICNNQNLSITNLSIGDSLSYDWQFQNASTSVYNIDGNPPSLNYSVEGVHDLYLEVTDNFSCTADTTLQISVFDVIADGTASANYSACSSPPLLVNFTNNSINNIDSNSVVWDFGNGVSSTDFSPSTLYGSPGEYIVTLTISSLTGCSDTAIVDTIVIEGPWGEFELLDSAQICNCDSVTFALTTLNATTPIFLTGDGQAVPFFPMGLPGDTILDTISVEYCGLGNFSPSLSFSEGACSYSVEANASDSIRVDSLISYFTFSNSVLCDSGSVSFMDSSYNEIGGLGFVTSWYWDFGTGNIADTSNLQNPNFFYGQAGSYEVCLTVENLNGCSKVYCDSLLIRNSPNVNFAMSDSTVCVNTAVNFYDSSAVYNGAVIDSWFWDFGTGNAMDSSNIQNPMFTYAVSGLYDVILFVVDDYACSSSDTNQIEVFDLPVITAFSDTFVCIGDSVQLSATGGLSYAWNPNFEISDTAVANPFVNPIIDTSYFVLGMDVNGCSNMDTINVNTSEVMASFSFTTACEGDTVFFTDLSTASLGTVDDWSWNFDDSASGLDSISILQNPYHIFNSSGMYNVSLISQNDLGCIDDTTILISVSVAPTAIIDFDSACVNTPISFSSLNSLDGSGVIISTDWDFGTGNIADTSILDSTTFTFLNPGVYNVCLTVTSDLACVANTHDTCVSVMVYSAPQAIEDIDTVCFNNHNTFDDLSLAGDGNIVSHFWDFGQNIADTLLLLNNTGDTSFQYLNSGVYSVTHIVTDDLSCSDTSFNQAVVLQNPTANFTNSIACLGDTSFFNDLSSTPFGIVDTWLWNFDEPSSGVDSISALQNPFHVYGTSTNYNVTLNIETNYGCVADTFAQINISQPPLAIIDFDSACVNTLINFSSLNSINGSGTIVNTHWDFGTGNLADTSNLASPDFSFSSSGLYTVCLTVTSDLNCTGNTHDTCVNVLIYDAPQALEIVDTACLGLANSFDDLSLPGDGNIISNYWNFGQNVTDTLLINSANGDTSFIYNTYGSYSVTHIVLDDNLCSDTAVISTVVLDNPSSNFTYNSACLNAANSFTSNSTPGADGIFAIDNYLWDFDEGASLNLGSANQTFNFVNTGNHNVTLVVEDFYGCTDTSIQIVNVMSAPNAVINLSTTEICEGESIVIDGSSSTASTPGIQYAWDDDYNTGIDNLTSNYSIIPNSDAQVMLVVTDDNNCVDTSFASFDMHPKPVASFTNTNGCVGIAIDLNSTSTEGDTTINTFNWVVNSVSSANGQNTTFTPSNANTLNVQLIIEDFYNCTDTSAIVSVLVDTTTSAILSSNDTIICAPEELFFEVSGSSDSYLWTSTASLDNNNTEMVTASIETNTLIVVTGTSANNLCPQSSDSIEVILVPEPDISYTTSYNPVFVGLSTDVELDVIPFNAFTDSVIWQSSTDLNVTEGMEVEITPNADTDYPFTVFYYYDSVRCQIDSFVNIQILDECSDELVYAPNVFTPNNDYKNDVFRISGISIDYLNYLRIYDRWGNIVYEQSSIDFNNGRMKNDDAWDGNNQLGNYCNNGVYVFMYEGVCLNGESIVGSGNITLIR